VVVAKLEPGQRADVAGLRPLEVITHVDDEPVKDAAHFGKLVEGKTDLKLTVKRAAQERVMRVSVK
jgi:serine protease Do